MKNNVRFRVSVIGCNSDTFQENYGEYIQAFRDGMMGDKVFFLDAPEDVKDEIAGLNEEGIEITMRW